MFEDTLLDRVRRFPARVKLYSAVVAAAIHIAVGLGYFAVQLWAVGDVPDPTVSVTLWLPPPPPPPPPAAAPPPPKAKAVPEAKPQPEPQPTPEIRQPQVVPPQVTEVGASSAGMDGGISGGVEGGVVGGVEGGVVGGEVGGVVGGVPGGLPGAPMRPGIGGVSEPRRVKYVRPIYPEGARLARTEGTVILEIVVDKQGNVTNTKVLLPLANGLTEAAITAVKQWRYDPAMLNGEPVDVYVVVTVAFSLI